jgi:conjugative transfer signal peptidase TraF
MNDGTAIPGCTGEVCAKTSKADALQGIKPREHSKNHKCLGRSLRHRKAFIIMAGALLPLLVLQVVSAKIRQGFCINLSHSVPPGFYKILPHSKIRTGDLVIFDPPQGARPYIYGRRWLPNNWPLIKYVGAQEGDTYAVQDGVFTVNAKYIGPVYEQDSNGKALPNHGGRRRVERNAFLPVSTHINNSFDGRYFGTVPLSAIRGKLKPIWTF